MIAQERLYLTRDRKTLVGDGDKRAAELYATPGTEIPESAAKLFGLTDGRLGKGRAPVGEDKGDGDKGGGKEKAPNPDKEKQPDGDKSGSKGAADDLTKVRFVGAKSAAALIAAGIDSFAAIAAIDPAKPPEVAGLGASVNWSGIVASAIELHEAS